MIDVKPRLLLVDDDPALLRLLSIRLDAAGYEVVTAFSGAEALGKLPTFRPQVVVSDLRMDNMDGMALFEILSEQNPLLPVIILTAHGTIPDAVAATQRGLFGYLSKPVDSKALLDCIGRAVQAGISNPNSARTSDDADWRREIISRSVVMEELLERTRRVADSDVSILIQGESGTGKELLARAIHRASQRAAAPFVAVNCSAIPEQLLESELFGHMKGSFTGAIGDHKGLFQAAHGGTLFLDEIGDMPISFQAKLLRALHDREIRPVGATHTVKVDVRVISATHRKLEQAIVEGAFREDLYYRLNVVLLELPALRERPEDIPLLAMHSLRQIAERSGDAPKTYAPDAIEMLIAAPWPGNVRQLLNVVEQTFILSTGALIPASQIQKALRDKPSEVQPLAMARDRFEHDYLVRLLQITEGNVSHAARLAQRNRTEFYKLLNRHQLYPELFRSNQSA